MFRISRTRFGRKGKRYVTHTTRWGRRSPYSTKSWRYNGKRVSL